MCVCECVCERERATQLTLNVLTTLYYTVCAIHVHVHNVDTNISWRSRGVSCLVLRSWHCRSKVATEKEKLMVDQEGKVEGKRKRESIIMLYK